MRFLKFNSGLLNQCNLTSDERIGQRLPCFFISIDFMIEKAQIPENWI
jgi:hypothetical protein